MRIVHATLQTQIFTYFYVGRDFHTSNVQILLNLLSVKISRPLAKADHIYHQMRYNWATILATHNINRMIHSSTVHKRRKTMNWWNYNDVEMRNKFFRFKKTERKIDWWTCRLSTVSCFCYCSVCCKDNAQTKRREKIMMEMRKWLIIISFPCSVVMDYILITSINWEELYQLSWGVADKKIPD